MVVDPVTNLVEIVCVYSTSAEEASQAFVNTWLSRYPLPEKVVTDGGPEFTGNEWEFMLQNWGLKRGRIMAHTPTANSIIKSSHRSMGQVLWTILDRETPTDMVELNKVVDLALACTMRALRCASSTSLEGGSTRSIGVWTRYVVEYSYCDGHCLFNKNWKQSRFDYEVGGQVYVDNHFTSADKLRPVWKEPFKLLRVERVQYMSASLFDPVCQLKACKFMFPSQWCGMSMSCMVRQVWSLVYDQWLLLVWESAVCTNESGRLRSEIESQ